MSKYLVKICGLTRLEDALLACELGAWALGLVFAPSPRQMSLRSATELVQGLRAHGIVRRLPSGGSLLEGRTRETASPFVVGVFTTSSPDEIVQAVVEAELDGVQLHGEEGPEVGAVRSAMERERCPAFIIKAVPIEPGQEHEAGWRRTLHEAARHADLVLLDSRVGGRFGGTGISFAWGSVRLARVHAPFVVAGGIGPDNVGAALLASGAVGVDVSSGVERAPGVKDPDLMKRLFQEVRRVSEKACYCGGGNK